MREACRICDQASVSFRASGDSGCVAALSRVSLPSNTAGKARLSTLPLGVRGMPGTNRNIAGTM
ncbi:hypothetical protein D3C80_904090 [compost metagenome]